MDKFVVRIPRECEKKKVVKAPKLKKKQTTLETLSRVVIVERIHKHKDDLKNPQTSSLQIINILKELDKSIPSKEVLLETKIGHVVNKLRSHSDKEVKAQARILLKKWKRFYREVNARQAIHVRSDLKTETFRAKARTMLSKELNMKSDHALVDAIEKVVFTLEKSVNNMMYRKRVRTICMKLRNDHELNRNVVDGAVKPEDLCVMATKTFT